jgi:CRP-like cAMP-binding protein
MTEKFTDINLLRKIPVLNALSDKELKQIINAPGNNIVEFKPKETIIRESEVGDCMYVILEGAVNVLIRGEGGGMIGREINIATLRPGDFFGESSLNPDTTGRRKASVRAYLPTKLFKIDKQHVHVGVSDTTTGPRSAATTVPRARSADNEVKQLMKDMRMFERLKEEELATVDTWAEVIKLDPGEFVIKESEKGDCLYVVLSGSVEIFTFDENDKIVVLAEHLRGDYFGEQALLPGSSGERTAYARTNGPTRLIKIPKAYFRLILNRDSELSTALKKIADARTKELHQIHKK